MGQGREKGRRNEESRAMRRAEVVRRDKNTMEGEKNSTEGEKTPRREKQ